MGAGQAQAGLRGESYSCQNVCYNVAWRHQVNVVAAICLQLQHDRCQLLNIIFRAVIGLADVIVLAELAAEVAAGEEDGAGSPPARQRKLLAQVRAVATHPGEFASLALA